MPFRQINRVFSRGLAMLTFFALLASASWDWAYFQRLGTSFVFMASPSDYIMSTFRWLPPFVLAASIIFLLEMFLSRVEGFRSEEEIIETSPIPKFTRIFRMSPAYMIMIVFVIGGLWQLFAVDKIKALNVMLPVLGIYWAFCMWFVRHPVSYETLGIAGRRLIFWVPVISLLILSHGYDTASADLAISRGEYRVVYSTGEKEGDIHLLRSIGAGVLILRVSTKEISFLPHHSYDRIDRISSSEE